MDTDDTKALKQGATSPLHEIEKISASLEQITLTLKHLQILVKGLSAAPEKNDHIIAPQDFDVVAKTDSDDDNSHLDAEFERLRPKRTIH